MPNGDSDPLNSVVHPAQAPGGSSPAVCTENDIDTVDIINATQSKSSNHPEVPAPSPGGTLTTVRAPESVTLLERYQAAVRHIRELENHSTRLYEDNCRLVNAVNMLNERVTFVSAPQNVQALRFADIQEKLRASEGNRALISRKYQELLQSTSVSSAQRHLYEELQAIRDAYTSLDQEYRLLVDKYSKLKVAAAQQQSRSTAPYVAHSLVPATRPEFPQTMQFLTQGQGRNNHPSPTSPTSPGSFQPQIGQNGIHGRRSSESVMTQPPLHPGPSPIGTNWSPHLPTPPPSAPLPMGQISPTGFPVHTSVPAGSLPIPHPLPTVLDPHNSSGLQVVTQLQHAVKQATPEQLHAIMHLRGRCDESTDTTNREPFAGSKEVPNPTLLALSSRPPKRTSPEIQAPVLPDGEHKKPRIEVEADRPITINADAHLSPSASNGSHKDDRSSETDPGVRSYQDCVGIIFEKDAGVENGVFCGLCLDRYDAKMIPEPPDVLVQPDFDLLVRHCMTEHPTVWNDLRRKA